MWQGRQDIDWELGIVQCCRPTPNAAQRCTGEMEFQMGRKLHHILVADIYKYY